MSVQKKLFNQNFDGLQTKLYPKQWLNNFEYISFLFENSGAILMTYERLTMGGWLCSALMSWRYLLMFLEGSMSCCNSQKILWYFPGSLSQLCRSLDTAPCPSPLTMANIELKFLHSLHCPVQAMKSAIWNTGRLAAKYVLLCTLLYYIYYYYYYIEVSEEIMNARRLKVGTITLFIVSKN